MWIILYLLWLFIMSCNSLMASTGYLFMLTAFVYGASYMNTDTRTGRRRWPWLQQDARRLMAWFFPIHRHAVGSLPEKCLYLVHPSPYYVALLMTGDYVALPRQMFWIPVVRDFLLWMGGIDEIYILEAARKGSVSYAPACLEDVQDPGHGDRIRVHVADADIFEFAVRHSMSVVPVLCYGESQLYVRRHSGLQPLTRIWLGYPFAPVEWGLAWSFVPRQREMHIYCGEAKRMESGAALKKEVYESLEALNVTEQDAVIELIE